MSFTIPYEKEYRDLLQKRGLAKNDIENKVKNASEYAAYLETRRASVDESSLSDVKEYIRMLREEGRNTLDEVDSVCMYVNAAGKIDQYLYLAELVGGAPLYASYFERTKEIAGEKAAEAVFSGFEFPPIGSTSEDFPNYTREMLRKMKETLSEEQRIRILAGNHHKRSPRAFDEKKKLYEESRDLDDFLRRDHEHTVQLLEEHMRDGRLWYRKRVDQTFLDYISSDQERLSARREGDILYVKQIPYEFEEYIEETDLRMRRFYFCHCHLARRSILEGEPISGEFCHCSGGYLKQPYDHIFGEELEGRVLNSALRGDDECRFAIKLPENWKTKGKTAMRRLKSPEKVKTNPNNQKHDSDGGNTK